MRLRSWGLTLGLTLCLAGPVGMVRGGEADPEAVNAMLKQMITDLAKTREENEALQSKLKAAQATAAQLDQQNRQLDETNRRLRAVLRDLADRGFPVYEVLGKTPGGVAPPAPADLTPEIATRLAQLLDVLSDAPQPRPDHAEDWEWSDAAKAARDELVKLGTPAVDPLLGLAAHNANPVVKMRAGVTILQIRQQSQTMVSAKVLDVGDRNDLVSIGLGEKQGVMVGQVFLILRGTGYVGQSKVTRVWGDLCVAQAVDRQEPAQVGDQALALIDRARLPADAAAKSPVEAPTAPGGAPAGLLGPAPAGLPAPKPAPTPAPGGGLLPPSAVPLPAPTPAEPVPAPTPVNPVPAPAQ